MRHDFHVGGLLIAKREAIPTDFEGNRVAQRCTAEDFDRCPVAEAHFQQPAADIGIPGDRDDMAMAANAELVKAACGR